MEAYRYSLLGDNEIRLLEILPGTKSNISLLKQHVSLDDPPQYAALSYTWGTDPAARTVFVDGKIPNVTPNLEAALHEFRARPV